MDAKTTGKYAVAVLGVLGLLALAPFYFASGLMAPGWAVAAFVLIWIALLLTGLVWFRRRPWWVPALPIAGALIWWGGMTAGEAFLGWVP